MERVLSQDERIRRAEEIYARRQSLRERTKRARVNVSNNDDSKNLKLFKRVFLQIIICSLIYCIFYLINTTDYSFSEGTLNKTEELLSQDIDFIEIYGNVANWIGNYMSSLNVTKENVIEENKISDKENNTNEVKVENTAVIPSISENAIAVSTDIQESTVQTEIKDVKLSETDRIKQKYSFIVPVKRKYNI